jgi:multicomponent Na+:H+ antiporter subunit D
VPYTAAHVVNQLQVVLFGAFVFFLLIFRGRYPLLTQAIVIDTDWFYIKGSQLFFKAMDRSLNRINSFCENVFAQKFTRFLSDLSKNAPARLALVVLIPLWNFTEATHDHVDRMRRNVYRILETGSVPLGISAAAATLWIVVIYVLS